MSIDRHTSETLEYPKVLSLIEEKCLTAYGPEEVAQFVPMFDRAAIETRLAEVQQLKDIFNFGSAFPLYDLDDCRELLNKSQVDGVFLEPQEIRAVLELIEVSMALHDYDREKRENFPEVTVYLKSLRAFPDVKKEIDRAIDRDGLVKDKASVQLRRIRTNLHSSKRRIIEQLERLLSSQQKQAGWQDDVVTQRNGRYVIPILAGQYKADQGIMHDRSQSGATFFVEPRETVELNNRINLLAQEEHAEVIRILRTLTAEIGQRAEDLMENTRLIGKLDALYGAAKFANDIGATQPRIDDAPRFDIHEARHPLLIKQFGSAEKVVPLSVMLDADRQALLITGPNTGGKTVALKTIGLTALMSQAGLLVPAKETSTYGIYHQIYADIGDEQSLELSLSTFSSHIKNISQAVANVSERSLAFLDEIGAGTDPKEGAALAEAIILHMVKKGTRLIASTHYSQLKTLALDHPGIENASLEFNRETLAPTYKLLMGIPGSSYALEIAGRLGIPTSICNQASNLLGSGERSMGELIASLETELSQVREDRTRLADRLTRVDELERFYKSRTEKFEKEIDERRQSALAETNDLLESTRRELEKLVADIRKSQAEGRMVKQAHKFIREAGSLADKLRGQGTRKGSKDHQLDRFAPGDSVRIVSLNQEGELTELIGDHRARVQVGAMNTVVSIRDLEKLERQSKSTPARRISGTPTTDDANREIHLRGMTVEDATEALDRFLDQAVVAGLSQFYVIHGK
jgi:DNA mismatch repair protein MutS2